MLFVISKWMHVQARKDDIIVCINHLTVDQVDEVAEVLHTKVREVMLVDVGMP